jgi:hypothetical protein
MGGYDGAFGLVWNLVYIVVWRIQIYDERLNSAQIIDKCKLDLMNAHHQGDWMTSPQHMRVSQF